MSFRERLVELTSISDVDQFLETHPTCALFKAGACHKTMQGFGYVEDALADRENIHMAFVRVIEQRPVSNYIEELTGIVHQSPQFILMVEKTPVYDVDNWDIVPEGLEQALEQHLGANGARQEGSQPRGVQHADVAPYKALLQSYLSGDIEEEEFKGEWLRLFQLDSTLRSTQEFDLLNSLFGDVDQAIMERESSGPLAMASGAAPVSSETLKVKAEKLLQKLDSAA